MILKKHLIVSFDGLDGCGKTTQIQLLAKWCAHKEITYHVFRMSSEIEDNPWLLENIEKKSDKELELAIFFLNQAYKYTSTISKLSPSVIILDRWLYSTFIYNGVKDSIKNIINEVYCHVAQPTLSFFIDTDIRTCIKRIMDRESDTLKQLSKECILQRAMNIHEHRNTLNHIIRENLIIINGDKSIDEINQDILKYICKELKYDN